MKKSKFILIVIFCLGIFLRFYHLDKVPYGLYIDEVSIGYNAQTILQSGKDEHGVQFPLFFKAFGEYKEPVYIYLTSASIALFGKNDFAVRFPSAFLGSLSVLVVYFLVKELLYRQEKKQLIQQKYQEITALTAAFLLAISPWHLHFSRGGFEANVALFFYLLGVLLFLLFWRKKSFRYIIFSSIALLISIYTYNTYKIISPVTWLIAAGALFFTARHLRKKLLFLTSAFFLACSPITLFSLTAEGGSRFTQTSAFAEVKTDNTLQMVVLYPMVYLKNYISFFSPDFLFVFGDHNGRHQAVGIGLLYKWQLPFIFAGLFWIFKQKNKILKLTTLGILMLSPIVPAVAAPSPHTLRDLLMVIPLNIITAFGLSYFINAIKGRKKVLLLAIPILVICIEFTLYIHRYYAHYPNVNALDWGAGYKETALKASSYSKNFDYIVVDKKFDFAPIYFHFYSPDIRVIYAGPDWKTPKAWDKSKILFIRPFYGNRSEKQSIDEVYLPGPNRDIFAQFWKL